MIGDSSGQYLVDNADGTPVEPGAQFLVLRLDGSGRDAERWAAQTFALFAGGKIGRAVLSTLDGVRERVREHGFSLARKVTYAPNDAL